MVSAGAGSADDGTPGTPGRSSAPDAAAAQAARDVLLMLSRAVQQATIYPPGHPNIAVAARPVVEALGRALDRAPHLLIAFTSDGAFAGPGTASLQAYDAPWLSHRMVDRGVASLDFAARPSATDAERLIGWLARGDAIAPGTVAPTFENCQVGTFDYSRARFRETRSDETRTLPVSLAWRTIASSLAGDWSGSRHQVPSAPVELAHYILDVLETQEGAGVGELSDRLAEVNALFVGLSDEVRSTVKGRLVEFVEALTPELRDRVLAASPREHPGKLDLLGSLVDRLPRARVIDVIRQLRFDRGDSTHQFMVLMLKLTTAATGDPGVAASLTAQCRSAGMPLPARALGDAAALQALEEMLSKKVDDALVSNPADYQAALEALSTDDLRRRLTRYSAAHLGDPGDAVTLSHHVSEVAAQLLRSGVGLEDDTVVCVARVQRELPRLLDAGQFEALADAADALAAIVATRPRPDTGRMHPELEFFASPKMVQEVLARVDRAGAGTLDVYVPSLARAGGAVVADALLVRLAQRPPRDVTRQIGNLLTSLDPLVVRAAVSSAYRRTPSLSRDLVAALQLAEPGPGVADIGRLLLEDADPVVRADACRLALSEPTGAQADAVMCRALQDSDVRVVDAALEAAERHPPLLASTGLRSFLSARSGAAFAPQQIRTVRLLAGRPTHASRAILIDALHRRGTRFDAAGRRVSLALCGALTRIGSVDATAAVAGWRTSPAGLISRLFGDRGEDPS